MTQVEDAPFAEPAAGAFAEGTGIRGEDFIDPFPSPSSSSPRSITLKVAYGLRLHDINLFADSTFSELKLNLAALTGVLPHEQRLLFKGKQQEDDGPFMVAGIKNGSKLMLLENPLSKERRLEEARHSERIEKACQAVAHVREEVDRLSAQVASLQATVENGSVVPEGTFAMLSELLMQQLLKLDSIDAEGEAKSERKAEVQRVQRYADVVDQLKAQSCNPNSKAIVLYTPEIHEEAKPI